MTEPSPGPASFAGRRNAVLHGREPPPLQSVARLGSYRWFVVGTVCVGAVMGQIDASMTQMLLPRLEHDFSAPLSTVSWVAVAYILAMASFMPVFGRLADMVGRKLLYITGFLVFVLGSDCAASPRTCRADRLSRPAGDGAALMTANSAISCWPPTRGARPRPGPAVGGTGGRQGARPGTGRPDPQYLAGTGRSDQCAGRPVRRGARLVRHPADQGLLARALRLDRCVPDRPRAHGARGLATKAAWARRRRPSSAAPGWRSSSWRCCSPRAPVAADRRLLGKGALISSIANFCRMRRCWRVLRRALCGPRLRRQRAHDRLRL